MKNIIVSSFSKCVHRANFELLVHRGVISTCMFDSFRNHPSKLILTSEFDSIKASLFGVHSELQLEYTCALGSVHKLRVSVDWQAMKAHIDWVRVYSPFDDLPVKTLRMVDAFSDTAVLNDILHKDYWLNHLLIGFTDRKVVEPRPSCEVRGEKALYQFNFATFVGDEFGALAA